jgi:hypothetical protein
LLVIFAALLKHLLAVHCLSTNEASTLHEKIVKNTLEKYVASESQQMVIATSDVEELQEEETLT